ncbi:hypothetical protein [Plantactinospora soyae]|uniref:EcsC family protein n=1 Tax=Plantactinospora soyae TaxID=1544732 RepID=A0A927M6F4_9ACTN|nr:hypothetical protein [Plantactinospora soyae]MBE1486278.1 hypothetical protein [Plantactinospora soyae]
MEEQPSTEPPRRRPEPKSTRGSGRTRAAFTSPPEPDPESTGEPPKPPRPRTRQTPPAVLFQPPTEPELPPPSTGSTVRPPVFPPLGSGFTGENSPEPGAERGDQPTTPAPESSQAEDSTPSGQDEPTPSSQATAPAPRKTTAAKKAAKPAQRAGAEKKTTAKKATAARTAVAKKATTAEKTTAAKKTAAKAPAVRKATTTSATTRVAAPPPAPSAAPTTSPDDPTPGPAESVGGPATPPAETSPGPANADFPTSESSGTPAADSTPPVHTTAREAVETEVVDEPTGAVDGTRVPDEVDVLRVDAELPDRAAGGRTPSSGSPRSTVRHVLDHPGYAPELLALAAVRELGPAALSWAARVRTAYPSATPDGLARLATQRYVRLAAAGGALSMATGLLAPFAELAVVTWAQAGLVLHLAAAHGHDPTAPDRAAELLVLTRVHPDGESARAALDAAAAALRGGPDGSSPRLAEAGWRLGAPIVARSVNWLALRLAVRRLPGATTLVTALASSAATERVAARATAHYRTTATGPRSADPPAAGAGTAGPPALPYNQSNQLGGSSA